jgi:Tripartite tricarboxylate transporter family receptor
VEILIPYGEADTIFAKLGEHVGKGQGGKALELVDVHEEVSAFGGRRVGPAERGKTNGRDKQAAKERRTVFADVSLAPVVLIADLSIVLLTRKDFPADNLPEFIAYAKANQAKLQYGSAGAGSSTHLACVLLNAAIGINVTHVPYRGGAPAMQDLLAGRSTDWATTASPA